MEYIRTAKANTEWARELKVGDEVWLRGSLKTSYSFLPTSHPAQVNKTETTKNLQVFFPAKILAVNGLVYHLYDEASNAHFQAVIEGMYSLEEAIMFSIQAIGDQLK